MSIRNDGDVNLANAIVEKAAEDWQQSEEKRNTEELLFKRQTEEASYYYSEMAKNIESLQEEYRAHVAL